MMVQELEMTWESKISPIIRNVFQHARGKQKESFYSREESIHIYTYMYDLTMTNRRMNLDHLEFLFTREMDAVKNYCRTVRFDTMNELLGADETYGVIMKWFLCFFRHLNRIYLLSIGEPRKMEDFLRRAFRDECLDRHPHVVETVLKQGWLAVRHEECETSVKNALRSFMGVLVAYDDGYQEFMTKLFLHESSEYYQRLREEDFKGMEVGVYISSVLALLPSEENVVVSYFTAEVWEDAKKRLVDTLVVACYDTIMGHPDHGWNAVLTAGVVDDIRNMSSFLSCSDSGWIQGYRQHIQACQENLGEGVLDFYELHDGYLREGIIACPDTATRHEFGSILLSGVQNVFQNTAGLLEKMLRNMDIMTRKKQGIARHLRLVDICHDKGLFQEHYRIHLQNRLLDGNAELEEELDNIRILQEKMGMTYVMGMRSMIEQIMESFEEEGAVRVSVLSDILFSHGLRLTASRIIPPPILDSISMLQNRWMSLQKTPTRLVPSVAHGNVVMMGMYPGRTYEFLMNPLQACILLWIQEHGPLSTAAFEQLTDSTVSLESVFRSMDQRTLRKQIGEDCWELCPDFHSPRKRVRLPAVSGLRKKDSIALANGVMPDLPSIVDAQIVRLLKQHKTITHEELIRTVTTRVRLVSVSASYILQRIESLIDRDYIGRGNSPQSYIYI
jgi:hypothetical protein